MPDTPSQWFLVAACSSCATPFSLSSTAVLFRGTLLGPRGVVLDVLGERWPESGQLLHPRCFLRLFGRRALWASFVRGRFDNGVGRIEKASAHDRVEVGAVGGSLWRLTVKCCECDAAIPPAGAAMVKVRSTSQRWQWLPVLQDHRPGQREVSHLACFVKTHGRSAAYAALGREVWKKVGPVVNGVGGAISN